MTRVAILPSAYPPAVGGVEELSRHLALTLADAGDEVEVWTLHGDDARPETVEVRDDLIVRRFPMPLPATKWSSLRRTATIGPRTLFSMRNAVDAFRPDVLHVICYGPNGAYANALSRLTKRPLIVTLQGETVMDDTDIFDVSRVLRRSLRRGLRTAAVVTGCSAFTLADAERRFGLEAGRGVVVPNGVDLSRAHTDGDGSGDHRGDPFPQPVGRYLLALGRVVEKKGFDLLLAAYAASSRARSSVELVIGGTGPALDRLRSQASELGVGGRVHFPGRLDRRQVAAAMAGAEAFVMPSRLEPFGIVVLEAWRAGVAVVATTHGGPPEFVSDGEDGLLADPFDREALASALDRLVTDDSFRRSLATAGRARVEAFSWPVVAERYRALYASVGPDGGTDRGVGGNLRRPQGESVS